MRRLALPALLLLPSLASAQSYTVVGGKHDAANVVLTLPGAQGFWDIEGAKGNHYGQASGKNAVLVIPSLKAGESITVSRPDEQIQIEPGRFAFAEKKGEHLDVTYGDRPVLRFVDKPHDPKDHYLTFKPFHQLFDPAEGKSLVTSGAHPNTKEFVYPHHRGLFFGFNKVTYGDKQEADVWHGTKDVYSTADKVAGQVAGPTFATHTAAISWHGADGKAFAEESRTVTVYRVSGGSLIDWSTELTTALEKVHLDGDPQHAGFHFRAAQEVAQAIEAEKAAAKAENRSAKPADTYYLRPDGKGKPGDTRNWDDKGKDPKTVNLPWDACSFVVGGKRYTAVRMGHPDNPKETRGSERDYARFGDYFVYDLTPKAPLRLKYRVWLQEGETTVERCEALYHGFVDVPTVAAKK